MTDFISPVFWYILTIGVLVTVHEWGHFIVARWCGVHVDRFSVGFGRALFKRMGRNGTEYRLALIPFGGYVKMRDSREQELTPAMAGSAFDHKPVGKRFAIVAAGPLANLLLCIALLWAALSLGTQELRPLLGPSTGLAQQAGFLAGDEIRSVDGTAVQTWNDALPIIALAAMDRRPLAVGVNGSDGRKAMRRLDLDRLPADFSQSRLLQEIGFTPFFANPSPIVGMIQPGSPADGILLAGDEITAIDGFAVGSFADIPDILAKTAQSGRNLKLAVHRDGRDLTFFIEPVRLADDRTGRWRLGIASLQATKTVQYPFWQALPKAVGKTVTMTSDSIAVIRRLLTGAASVDNLSGPIGIAKAADSQASWGLPAFLSFLAAISLALCIMNLLPIPLLDGGHLLYYASEWLTGRPVPENVQAFGQKIGLFLLVALLGIALFNDFLRILYN
jgi:regulator of sigma E protease